SFCCFFFQAEDGIRDRNVTGVQTCALPISDQVKELQQDVESTRPVIDKINALLSSSGFTSFHLVESDEFANGYKLARESGEVKQIGRASCRERVGMGWRDDGR